MKFPTHCEKFLALVAILLGTSTAPATAELPKSLDLVPANASFYSSSSMLREQFDAFVGSKAFARLKEMPALQMGMMMFQMQWNDPEGQAAPFKQMLAQPENQQLVELLADAVSHEIFLYGSDNYEQLLLLFNEINQANRSAQLAALGDDGEDAAQRMAEQMIAVLEKHLETMTMPDTVIGFRLSDTGPALAQLARLEQMAGFVLPQLPMLDGRFSRQQIGGGEFLTLQLDGSLVPWDQLPPDAQETIGQLRDQLSEMTLAVTLGVRGDYFIISIGDTNEHLATLGQGDLLADREELKFLSKYSRRPITSVGYASGSLLTKANSSAQQINQLVEMANSLLPLSELDADLQDELLKDVRELGEDIKAVIPASGAVGGVGFMTDRGYESYSYNYGQMDTLDDSAPLSILEHVGGDPLFVFAGRGKYEPERFKKFAHWCGRGLYYAEAIGVSELDEDARELFDAVRDDMERLLTRFGNVTQEKLLPAFKGGETAVVIDAKTTSDHWHVSMPQASEPLPILELGLVYDVSDPELLKQAAADYFQIAQEAIDLLHEADADQFPEFKLPAPESRDFPGGTVYYYRLPAQVGLNKQIAPNAGLSDDTLVLSLIPKMSSRLIGSTPFTGSGPLSNRNRPIATAFHADFAGLLEAIEPWIQYGTMLSGEEIDPEVQAQIDTGIEIAKCFRGFSGVTYREGQAWVTHMEMHFEDLK